MPRFVGNIKVVSAMDGFPGPGLLGTPFLQF